MKGLAKANSYHATATSASTTPAAEEARAALSSIYSSFHLAAPPQPKQLRGSIIGLIVLLCVWQFLLVAVASAAFHKLYLLKDAREPYLTLFGEGADSLQKVDAALLQQADWLPVLVNHRLVDKRNENGRYLRRDQIAFLQDNHNGTTPNTNVFNRYVITLHKHANATIDLSNGTWSIQANNTLLLSNISSNTALTKAAATSVQFTLLQDDPETVTLAGVQDDLQATYDYMEAQEHSQIYNLLKLW